ncbi:MAG: hypothetical protein AB1815_00830 [Bacillota bacterium]
MARPGEVKSKGLEIMLEAFRILIITGAILLTVGVGALLNVPPPIIGLIAGIFGFFLLVQGSVFEVTNLRCPACGNENRVVRHIGTYQCPQCETLLHVKDKEAQAKNPTFSPGT